MQFFGTAIDAFGIGKDAKVNGCAPGPNEIHPFDPIRNWV
jgi:hypothetical protein